MLAITENLWRNPLTKNQHGLAIKRWYDLYALMNPEKEAVPAPAATAVAETTETTATKDSANLAEHDSGTDAESASGGGTKTVAARAAGVLAATLGTSERTAKRKISLARRFDEEQLQALDQMKVTQEEREEIARITDPVATNQVINLIIAGMDVPMAIAEVLKDIAPTVISKAKQEAQAKAAAKAAAVPKLTDEEWYAQECGVPARYVAGTGGHFGMARPERKANLDAFKAREYQVIVCCELLIEGWDCPHVEAVGIARPTNQQYRYMQMVGRGTRPSPDTGKTNCLVVDFDWKCDPDVKDLCSAVDLFDDGTLDLAVYAEAKRIASERAVDVDPLEVIEEAERVMRTRKRFAVKLTGKEAKYESYEHDPVGVSKLLDIKLNRKYDLDKRGLNPASPAQLHRLQSLGVNAPEALSKWGASKLLGKLIKRQEQGLATTTQVQTLLSAGMNEELARRYSTDEASQAISQLSKIRSNSQMRLFE